MFKLFLECYTKKYFQFSGRASRKEYWSFVLFNFLVFLPVELMVELYSLSYFSAILSLFGFIPGLAVAVRRLHDTTRSGGWLFIVFLPVVGPIWLLILDCLRGKKGRNFFGPDPLENEIEPTVQISS